MPKPFPFAAAATAAFLLACGTDSDGEAGVSLFSLRNGGPDTAFAIFVPRGEAPDTTPSIPPGGVHDFHEKGAIGANPRPSEALGSFRVLRTRDSAFLGGQDPVRDSAWTREVLDGQRYGKVRFTFEIQSP